MQTVEATLAGRHTLRRNLLEGILGKCSLQQIGIQPTLGRALIFIGLLFSPNVFAQAPTPYTEYRACWGMCGNWSINLNAVGAEAVALRNAQCSGCIAQGDICVFTTVVLPYAMGNCTRSGNGIPVADIFQRQSCPSGFTLDALTNSCIPTCPTHASGVPCACDVGYEWDATHTSCESTCKITTKVADITDPVALLYEDGTYNSTDKPDLGHLTQAAQTGLACIQQKVAALNCYKTPKATSGYRPTAYQSHIREVYDKWQLIKDDNSADCADVKAAIEEEWLDHSSFARQPGATSNHSQLDAQGNPAGTAVDISFVPDNALNSADAIACQCNMYRPLMNMSNPADNDPIHYQPRTCLP